MSEASLTPEGRVVLVSGANRGIGRAVAEELHSRGYLLSLGARDVDSLAPLLATLDSGWRRRPNASGGSTVW
jgi:NAD(P)-dependent dehydrogenase (short-subunit alcohol dehydrogenase family)